jgi:plasmid stabilization system protein ParE
VDFALAWTEPAVADLEAAVRQAARRGQQAGEAFSTELLEAVGTLARFPWIGPAYEKDRTGQTREIAFRQYRIFYRVIEADKRVEVLAVYHSSRQGPRFSK